MSKVGNSWGVDDDVDDDAGGGGAVPASTKAKPKWYILDLTQTAS